MELRSRDIGGYRLSWINGGNNYWMHHKCIFQNIVECGKVKIGETHKGITTRRSHISIYLCSLPGASCTKNTKGGGSRKWKPLRVSKGGAIISYYFLLTTRYSTRSFGFPNQHTSTCLANFDMLSRLLPSFRLMGQLFKILDIFQSEYRGRPRGTS